ncbi:MAG: B12-binding domain-containing radical SAM protein, partial [bacterium]|nr:B12-binding domain-containing radical SAM protein [bacterium]
MKICLINPPNPFGGAPLPHMGIAYIAGMLTEKCEYAGVDLFDCPFQGINREELLKRLDEGDYDMIGITTYFYNFSETFRLLRKIKKLPKTPFIVLGGYYPTLHSRKTLETVDVDCICIGEGEYVMKDLVETLHRGAEWRQLQGLAYMNGENEYIENDIPNLIGQLDGLPAPRLPQEPLYWYPLTSGRGCHGKCTFCSIVDYYRKVPGQKIRKRTPANVVKELISIFDRYKNKIVWMMDDNFFAVNQYDKQWLEEFASSIRATGKEVKFKIFARADEIDRNVLKELQSVGLQTVVVGVESMVQRQLKLYAKSTTPAQNATT